MKSPETPPEEAPQVLRFRSWRGVYLLVLGSLALYIILLILWSGWLS
jgi:hypothetical protein